jgi:hypothetical protein
MDFFRDQLLISPGVRPFLFKEWPDSQGPVQIRTQGVGVGVASLGKLGGIGLSSFSRLGIP